MALPVASGIVYLFSSPGKSLVDKRLGTNEEASLKSNWRSRLAVLITREEVCFTDVQRLLHNYLGSLFQCTNSGSCFGALILFELEFFSGNTLNFSLFLLFCLFFGGQIWVFLFLFSRLSCSNRILSGFEDQKPTGRKRREREKYIVSVLPKRNHGKS